ncbi:helix-turn-helix domain-containing protein [Bacillus cereus]|uniref:Transposase family protein n=1 Tax=Bacillus cereus TaxID=1396 RepID=A0A9X7M141_BACCE|nr:transposase family protein [Bacillus cereus]QDZ76698.1 transposase family protein [Bacillus cereus]
MNYEQVSSLNDGPFKRLTGVKKETFSAMVKIVQTAYEEKHKRRGRKSTLSVEDMVLLMLNYLRSYSTFFEIGVMFRVSESSAHRIATWVEDVLISSGTFSLPSKKVLLEEDSAIEIILIDATEQEIERPKKNKENITQGRKRNTP